MRVWVNWPGTGGGRARVSTEEVPLQLAVLLAAGEATVGLQLVYSWSRPEQVPASSSLADALAALSAVIRCTEYRQGTRPVLVYCPIVPVPMPRRRRFIHSEPGNASARGGPKAHGQAKRNRLQALGDQ